MRNASAASSAGAAESPEGSDGAVAIVAAARDNASTAPITLAHPTPAEARTGLACGVHRKAAR